MSSFALAASKLVAQATVAVAGLASAGTASAGPPSSDVASMQVSASRNGLTLGGDETRGIGAQLWKGADAGVSVGFGPRYYLGSFTDGYGHTGLGAVGTVNARIAQTGIGALHASYSAGAALTYTHKTGEGTARPFTSVQELRLAVESPKGWFVGGGAQKFGNDRDGKWRPTVTAGAVF